MRLVSVGAKDSACPFCNVRGVRHAVPREANGASPSSRQGQKTIYSSSHCFSTDPEVQQKGKALNFSPTEVDKPILKTTEYYRVTAEVSTHKTMMFTFLPSLALFSNILNSSSFSSLLLHFVHVFKSLFF